MKKGFAVARSGDFGGAERRGGGRAAEALRGAGGGSGAREVEASEEKGGGERSEANAGGKGVEWKRAVE